MPDIEHREGNKCDGCGYLIEAHNKAENNLYGCKHCDSQFIGCYDCGDGDDLDCAGCDTCHASGWLFQGIPRSKLDSGENRPTMRRIRRANRRLQEMHGKLRNRS